MTIERRIYVTTGITIASILIIGSILLWNSHEVETGIDQIKTSSQIVRSGFLLRTLMDEYLDYGDERPLRQWNKHNEFLGRIIKEVKHFESIDPALLKDLEIKYQAVNSLHPQIIQFGNIGGQPSDLRTLQETLAGTMSVQLEELVNAAERLHTASQSLTLKRQKLAHTLILITCTLMIGLIVTNLYQIRKTIVSPLQRLSRGADIIGAGNFDYVVESKSKDEVGKLAQAFNAMVGRLRTTHDSLQTEMEERRRAQEDLRRINEELEIRVHDRTVELAKARDELELRVEERTEELSKEIEQRKCAEEFLLESEHRLRSVFENSIDAIFLVRPSDGKVFMTNQAASTMFGLSEKEICTEERRVPVDPNDPRLPVFLEERKHKGKAVSELNCKRSDGTIFPTEISGSIFTDASGNERSILVVRDISERKRSEEELVRWGNVFKHARWGILVTRDDLQSLGTMNPEFAEMHGYTVEELTGRSILDVFAPEERARVQEQIPITDRKGHYVWESKHIRKDGTIFPVLIDATAVKDEDGKVLYRVVNVQDITERKRAEEERASAAKEIEDLYNNAPCGYHSLDSNGVFVRINDTELSWLGYTREEVIGKKKFQDIITTESLKIFQENYPVFKDRGWVQDLEFDLVRKSGTILPVLLNATAVKDSSGNFFTSRSTIFDISERKRAEERLRDSENRFRSIFEQGQLGVEVLGLDGHFLMLNPAFSQLLGYSQDELAKSTYAAISHPDDLESENALIQKLLGDELRYFTVDKRYRGKNGETVWASLTKSIIRGEDGTPLYFLSMIQDINERKRMEELLQSRAEELARSNEDLQQFAYVASHDLQEPLRNVASCLQMLEKKYKNELGADADQYIHHAVESSVRMKALILDLLAYSRIGTKGKPPQWIDCEQILDQTVKDLRATAAEAGAVITHDPLPTIPADDTQLLQVFQNLVGNAIKFRRYEPPQIHVSAVKNKKEWIFSVKDNGIGIESRHLDRIFVIFQRLHKRSQYVGTGMGLAIVKKVVERHGGRVWVESEPGVGTTFYFTIPQKGMQT